MFNFLRAGPLSSNWNTSYGIDWWAALYVFLSPPATILGLIIYTYFNGVRWFEPVHCIFMFYFMGLGLTAGYHRYFSHRSHDAHPLLQIFYLITGATMVHRPILDWAHVHRVHHKFSDTDLDPHNINQGFYYAHMGWIYQKTSLLSNHDMVPDLANNPLVLWQKKYYWWLVLVFGAGVSFAIGWAFGRPVGGLLWGWALRVILQNQSAYTINSWAHTWGKQTYSKRAQARDSFLLALFSNGEGYHSFHHRFPSDYRNGVRWYQWDPSKWFVKTMSWIGLAKNLRMTSEADIQKAMVSG